MRRAGARNGLRLSIEDDIAFFERVPTLRLLGRTALRILAIGAESLYVHEGTALFKEDEPADGGYVVQDGSFVLKTGSGIHELVAGPGTLIGELALLTATRRPATATAAEPSTVIRISRSLFLKMLEGYPEAAFKLQAQLAERARLSVDDVVNVRAVLDAGEAPA